MNIINDIISFLTLFFGFIIYLLHFILTPIFSFINIIFDFNNASAAAFWGAFFAFIFMWTSNTRERKKNEEKEELKAHKEKEEDNRLALRKMSILIEEYLFLISTISELLSKQVESLNKHILISCKSEPFLFLVRIDENLILQIKSEQLRRNLFLINREIIGINHSSRAFNGTLSSDRTVEGEYIVMSNGAKTKISKEMDNYVEANNYRKENLKFFTQVKEEIDKEI